MSLEYSDTPKSDGYSRVRRISRRFVLLPFILKAGISTQKRKTWRCRPMLSSSASTGIQTSVVCAWDCGCVGFGWKSAKMPCLLSSIPLFSLTARLPNRWDFKLGGLEVNENIFLALYYHSSLFIYLSLSRSHTHFFLSLPLLPLAFHNLKLFLHQHNAAYILQNN